jgi:hypothetical protein
VESEQDEIERIRREQTKARRDAVYGGLSSEEWAAYDKRADRMRDLERRRGESNDRSFPPLENRERSCQLAKSGHFTQIPIPFGSVHISLFG